MTTMQNMSCMMHNSASATCADAASCAYTAGMQSTPIGMIIMGAMVMASIIILSCLVNSLILVSVHLITLLVLVVVLLSVVIKEEYPSRP